MNQPRLPYRQVHLDFHTSGAIPGVGGKFDKRQFQEALRTGNVDSITLFSKCHHGWSYHPTKVNEMHPQLNFDLLGAQLEACREIGVRAPVYISAGVDEKEAVRHPEWLYRAPDESLSWTKDFYTKACFHVHCFNTGYLDLLIAQIEEAMTLFDPCELFLDIVGIQPCYCARCRNDILARGKDPRDPGAALEQAEVVYANYAARVESAVRKYSPTCAIFHNGGHITRGRRDIVKNNSHLELESLPTGGWGYDHFPMSASYAMTTGLQYLGMTGKFHGTWGEFGGFKHPNALRYETSLSIAFGAKCSIGDQLHPSGFMNPATYELIGKAYREIEKKEPWCVCSANLADIAVLSQEAVGGGHANRDRASQADTGANRVLLEGKYLYNFIDQYEDLSRFKLLILPDTIRLSADLADRIGAYLRSGGKVLATGQSGLAQDRDEFLLDFGCDYTGESGTKPDYVLPEFDLTNGRVPHVMYEGGYTLRLRDGQCLLRRQNSYFDRDVYRFCSHQHTPNDDDAQTQPAGVLRGNTAYLGWNIFTDYALNGSLHLKEILRHCIEALIGDTKSLEVGLPDRGVATLAAQREERRYIAHLLFAHTTLRGTVKLEGAIAQKPIEVIEDIVPLTNVPVTLRVAEQIRSVHLEPEHQELPFTTNGSEVRFVVPKVEIHQMVSLGY